MAFEKAIIWLLTSRGFEDAEELALERFTDKESKKEVLELLKQAGLDEFAIEAEAIRSTVRDLEAIDRMLSSSETNRRKAFRAMDDYRAGFAKVVRASSDRAIERNRAPILEFAPNN